MVIALRNRQEQVGELDGVNEGEGEGLDSVNEGEGEGDSVNEGEGERETA